MLKSPKGIIHCQLHFLSNVWTNSLVKPCKNCAFNPFMTEAVII